MVEARLLAEFRSCEVSVQRMRPAIVRLRQEFGAHPLAQAQPFLGVEGREPVRIVQDQVGLDRTLLLVVVRNGQAILTAGSERFRSSVDHVDDNVAGRRPEARTQGVVTDPLRVARREA